MATLYVRNFPDDLHKRVKELAAKRRRSFGAEVVVLVAKAVQSEQDTGQRLEALNRIAERRRNFKLPPGAQDAVSMLREDRER